MSKNEQHQKQSENSRYITEKMSSRLKENFGIDNTILSEYPDLIKLIDGEILKCYHLPYQSGDEYRDHAIVGIDRKFDMLWVFKEKNKDFCWIGSCHFNDMTEDYTGKLTPDPIRKILLSDLSRNWAKLIKELKKKKE